MGFGWVRWEPRDTNPDGLSIPTNPGGIVLHGVEPSFGGPPSIASFILCGKGVLASSDLGFASIWNASLERRA